MTESELERMIERLRAIPDRRARLKATQDLLLEMQERTVDLAELRRDDVIGLHQEEDVSYVEIGKMLKITKMSAGRIANTKLRRKGRPDSANGPAVDNRQAAG